MADISKRYALDSSALLAFLWDEAGAGAVEDVLTEEGAELFMSAVNLGEVLYIVHRLCGEEAAAAVEAKVMETPRLRVVDATWESAKRAARIKAERRLPFADCFCAGLAQEKEAMVVTCDRYFEGLEREGKITVLWLQAGGRCT